MLKQAVVIAAVAAKKKAALSKRAGAAVPNLSSKVLAKRSSRFVKLSALQNVLRSWRRKEAATPDAPPPAPLAHDLLEQRPSSTGPASQALLVLETVEPVTASTTPDAVDPSTVLPGGEPVTPVQPAAPVLEAMVERQSPQHLK